MPGDRQTVEGDGERERYRQISLASNAVGEE